MTSKKELKFAYWLAIVFLVTGILSYTAFSAKAPEKPVRKMYECSVGKVLFDHKVHVEDYDISCNDCHHPHPRDEEVDEDAKKPSCGSCHNLPADGSFPLESCADCHDDPGETEGMINQTDALHKQCIECHKENDAGPMECVACHVM